MKKNPHRDPVWQTVPGGKIPMNRKAKRIDASLAFRNRKQKRRVHEVKPN